MKKPKCEECEFWVFTHVLMKVEKIWHCRDGFKPYNVKWGSCKDMCKYNDRIIKGDKNENLRST